jgi:hypothetical protein
LALARSHHTVSIANDKACIFGGQTTDGKLASNDIHTVTLPLKQTHETDIAYACYPAVPRDEGAAVPSARTRHAACVQGHELAVFGGCDEKHAPVDQDSSLWIWNIESSKWHQVSSEGYVVSFVIRPVNANDPTPVQNLAHDSTTNCSIMAATFFFTADDRP